MTNFRSLGSTGCFCWCCGFGFWSARGLCWWNSCTRGCFLLLSSYCHCGSRLRCLSFWIGRCRLFRTLVFHHGGSGSRWKLEGAQYRRGLCCGRCCCRRFLTCFVNQCCCCCLRNCLCSLLCCIAYVLINKCNIIQPLVITRNVVIHWCYSVHVIILCCGDRSWLCGRRLSGWCGGYDHLR